MTSGTMADVSSHQPVVNSALYKNDNGGKDTLLVKATEGLGYIDPSYPANVAGARANDLRVGHYHFARSNDPAAEAAWFWQTVKPNFKANAVAGWGDVLVYDMENIALARSLVRPFTIAFFRALNGILGEKWLYSGAWFLNGTGLNASDLPGVKLWVASYTASPILPMGWAHSDVVAWQFTSQAHFDGIGYPVDDSYEYQAYVRDCPGFHRYDSEPIVLLGSSGPAVQELQRALNTLSGRGLTEDGIFGKQTKQAVIDFQRLFSLTIDGIAGPQVWHALAVLMTRSNRTTTQGTVPHPALAAKGVALAAEPLGDAWAGCNHPKKNGWVPDLFHQLQPDLFYRWK